MENKKPLQNKQRPELLAPAGDWSALKAAAAAGADAVYWGLPEFNARARAANFSADDAPAVIDYLHARGLLARLTLNTILHDHELLRALDLLEPLVTAGLDAVIVADLGLAALIRRYFPDLSLHASTQTAIGSPVALGPDRLPFDRVILPRELSLAEIEHFIGSSTIPTEVFVHGAICFSFSGQCRASLTFGGRSANRGQCAGACRLPWRLDLPTDAGRESADERPYPLSTRDLAAHRLLPELVRLGVAAFKIEGRLKDARYVYQTVSYYRRALDAALAGESFTDETGETELRRRFSRGFTSVYLRPTTDQRLIDGKYPAAEGVLIGRVTGRDNSATLFEGTGEFASGDVTLAAGDGIAFAAPGKPERIGGGRVLSIELLDITQKMTRSPGVWRLRIRDASGGKPPSVGTEVWKTSDARRDAMLDAAAAREKDPLKIALDFYVEARVGQPLRIEARTADGRRATAESIDPLAVAKNRPVDLPLLREQLGRLGETGYCLGDIIFIAADPVMTPKSELNALRRQLTAALDAAGSLPGSSDSRVIARPGTIGELKEAKNFPATSTADEPLGLRIVVRSLEQLAAVSDWAKAPLSGIAPPLIFFDPESESDLLAATEQFNNYTGVAAPFALLPGEENKFIERYASRAPIVMVRNVAEAFAAWEISAQPRLFGDSAMNIVNSFTGLTVTAFGIEEFSPGPDATIPESVAACTADFRGRAIFPLYFHQPLFHSRYCFYSDDVRGISAGCGATCRRRRASLYDRKGEGCDVFTDPFCRTLVYRRRPEVNARQAQDAAGNGARRFLLEFTVEPAATTVKLLDAAVALLLGKGNEKEFLQIVKDL